MELYINSTWTRCYEDASYMAQAVAWSENGNHATIYATGNTADEADAKLEGALRELKLMPEKSSTKRDSEVKTENPDP
jgi:hypothetical protein